MFGRNSIMFLCAGIFATLAACHQAKPATAVSEPAYQAQPTSEDSVAATDRTAREVTGYAPSAKQPAHEITAREPARAPVAAPAPEDDSQRLFDIP
jgi:hypothetical protein